MMSRDRARYLAALCGVALITGWTAVDARAQSAAARAHVEAARAAVAPKVVNPKAPFHSFQRLFDQVCAEPKLPDVMRVEDRSAVVPRKEWFAWPADIFDNLFFIGTKTAAIWAINTSDGIIVIDANFHYSSRELVLGLLHFGLDPAAIKYIIITHAHDDRYWGAKALQDTYPNARVAMSAADWDLVAKDNSPAQFKPRKDMVITDGQQIRLGEVTVTAYITPGHTPGTLSLIVGPLTNQKSVTSDDGRHVAAIWGGVDASIGRQGVRLLSRRPGDDEGPRDLDAALHGSGDESRRRRDPVYLHGARQHCREDPHLEDLESGSNPARAFRTASWERWRSSRARRTPFVSQEAVERYHRILLECYRGPAGMEGGVVASGDGTVSRAARTIWSRYLDP